MELEALNFREALELLAQRAGVELKTSKSKEEYQKEKNIKSQIYQINRISAEVYHKILLEAKYAQNARGYLKKRGVNQQTINEFKIGYAPDSSILYKFLIKRGFNAAEIRQAGSPENFRNRLVFPIFDIMDNVVGFSARALEKNQEPKYINTPDTPIYHKSSVLYGLNKAKTEIRKKLYSLIVEGQMDVVLSHQVGVKTAVASSGIALTENHLDILTRYSDNILFAFDQDEAGTQAVKRSINMALARGISLKIVVLPTEFKDAGEAILKDPKVWVKAVKTAVPVVEWYFDKVFAQYKGDNYNSIDKKNIAKQLIPIMQKITDNIERAHYIQQLAKKLAVPERFIEEAVARRVESGPARHASQGVAGGKSINPQTKEYQERKIETEDLLVILLLKFPQFLEKVVIDLDYNDFSQNSLAQKIYKFLQSCYTKTECDNSKSCQVCNQINSCLKKKLSKDEQKQLKELELMIEKKYPSLKEDEVEGEILQCAKNIQNKKRETIKSNYADKIAQAEQEGNIEKLKQLLEEFQNIISE
ncbi:MAG: toprim domain-containing protein [Patescibacteria group bacterium]|nr:toprim domain-containing protein [Patescibacteria group bacterium]